METSCSVSIIVPVCNVQKYLRQCLNSLTDQTLQDIQIICIDDGSTDDSLEIMKEFALQDPRIDIISKPNAGYGHTMNCGLKAARGEYVGIVESDDFAELDMFENLYALAKQYDVDVIKSNYFQYLTGSDPAKGPVVENLSECEYGTVFCPLDDQNIFLTQPAIWSALYRREFLENKKIRFLETPGASFQDTSFNFKVFSLAKKVFLTKKPYLHYRIDNDNSSVKSLKKVFCICDEYQHIWDFARSHLEVLDSLKYRIPQIQFGGYVWNLERLTPRLQYQFYEKIVEEYTKLKRKHLIRKEYFDDIAWEKIQGILSNPNQYFVKHYGPIEVETTYLVVVKNHPWKSFKKFADKFRSFISNESEAYFYTTDSKILKDHDYSRYIDSMPNFHVCDEELTHAPIPELNHQMIRGEQCCVLELGGPEWDSKSSSQLLALLKEGIAVNNALVNNAWAVGMWKTSKLAQLDLPIILPLLFFGFYLDSDDSADSRVLPTWICNESFEQESRATKGGYLASYENLKKLYNYWKKSPLQDRNAFTVFGALWLHMREVYNNLEYEDRQSNVRPSAKDFSPFIVRGASSRSELNSPTVSVIIPVYNAESYLSTCLKSVLSQKNVSLEVVCVDDGSTDNSLKILDAMAVEDNRIIVVSQLNGGAGAARNSGISFATGDYFIFIDPDDLFSSDDVLSKLVNAAMDNDVLVSGGSLSLLYPDGSKKEYFGGDQSFYTIRREGISSLSSLQADYGWIRFMYHRSIFDEGKVRFPEYRWYEDPVFLTRVMDYNDVFYGICDSVYTYRIDYKEKSWDVVKARDLLRGITENLSFAQRHKLKTMYTTLISRIEHDYYQVIMEYLDDLEVLQLLINIQSNLDLDLLNNVQDNARTNYLIRPFYEYKIYGTAIVRLARRAEKGLFYKKLQDFRLKHRQK